jgi:L-fuculose-phosphate aldolase
VRVAGYARFGTRELSEHTLKALENRNACLLANHGMIATGTSLEKAMWLAVELETIARQYYLSLALGAPHILGEAEIAETAKGFSTYGLQAPKPKSNAKSNPKPAKARAAKAAARQLVEKKRSGKR